MRVPALMLISLREFLLEISDVGSAATKKTTRMSLGLVVIIFVMGV